MARIELRSVGKKYGGTVVVKDFNLTVEDGEFIVLVGPSGCGKSTVLRMIAGLTEVTEGEILINGVRVNHLEPRQRDVAMVFQNYALYPHMNVYQNMAFGLKMRKMPASEIDRKIRETAAVLGISELLGRKPKQLSGGQRQRVALGRAIVRNPGVFLMDEPLSNLDAQLRMQMRTEIIKIHRRLQATFIYVTHDQVEAMTMGDRIVVVKDGLIQQVGSPQEIYRSPANVFVAGFIGSPQMNLFDGNISDNNTLASLGGELNLVFPVPNQNIFKSLRGKILVLGIRPEDIKISFRPLPDKAMRAKVDLVEHTGSDKIVFASIGGLLLTIKADADFPVKGGETIWLTVPPRSLHIFDKDNGRAIYNPLLEFGGRATASLS